ncbi:endosome-associated-trafficking regulator 1-like isoform X2 [Oscarella lobularis]|uniref:endosome-associated-trafficking regulator 1-like isoform X2 n=1 Tax=Oscarella lobularis TaxID=121494 RepID=UPI0033132213
MEEEEEKIRKEANPFSFKAFVKKSAAPPEVRHSDSEDDMLFSKMPPNASRKASLAQSGPNSADSPFPEVAADENDETLTIKGKKKPKPNPFSFTNFVKRETKPKKLFDSDSDDDVDDVVVPPPPVSAPPKRSVSKTVDIFDDEFESEGENDDPPIINYKLELEKIKLENSQLKDELKSVTDKLKKETQKSATLKKKMETLKKKEKEETAALENMVHMVEKNLKISTERAVKAETKAAQLQQELHASQATLSDAGRKHFTAHYQAQFVLVEDQSHAAAEKMINAAMKAQKSLEDLKANVDDLKLASALMQSVARTAHVAQAPMGSES